MVAKPAVAHSHSLSSCFELFPNKKSQSTRAALITDNFEQEDNDDHDHDDEQYEHFMGDEDEDEENDLTAQTCMTKVLPKML